MEPLPERERTKVRVQSSPQPSPFQGEGERREARMKRIFWATVLMLAGNLALWPAFGQNNSQDNSAGQAHHYHAHLTPTQRKMFERKAKELYGVMKVPSWIQRSDHDQYVILSRFLAYSGILSSTPTARVDEAEGLWKNLLDKNPRWKTRPPRDMNVKEYHEAIQKQKDEGKTIEEKAKTWRPKDTIAWLYHDGSRLAAVHQYRIDFFNIPKSVECYATRLNVRSCDKLSPGLPDFVKFKKGGQDYNLKPFKTITFGQPITIAPVSGADIIAIGASDGYGWLDFQEEAIMDKLEAEGRHPAHWVQPNANFDEFYGVLSIAGKVLARIPFHEHIPDKALKVAFSDPDGKLAAFLVGQMAHDYDEGPGWGFSYRSVSGVIVWTPKRGLRTLSPSEAKKEFPILKRYVP